jgi:predicted SAM-dependent methyltransferase
MTDRNEYCNNRLNLGCGHIFYKNWMNIGLFEKDEFPYGQIIKQDNGLVVYHCNILTDFTFEPNSVDNIYASHFIEHIKLSECIDLLSKCYKALKPNGILRFTFPDLELWINNYYNNNNDFFQKYYNASKEGHNLPLLQTKGEIFMSQLYCWEHKWGYDFSSMKDCMLRAGFHNVYKKKLFDSLIPDIRDIEIIARDLESCYVEAIK